MIIATITNARPRVTRHAIRFVVGVGSGNVVGAAEVHIAGAFGVRRCTTTSAAFVRGFPLAALVRRVAPIVKRLEPPP